MSKKVLVATGGYDHTIRFWEAASGICYRTLQFSESHVNRLSFSPDKVCLAVAGNPRIVVFDAVSNVANALYSLDGHRGNVIGVGYETFGSWIFSGSEDGTLRIWDPRNGKQVHAFQNRIPLSGVLLHPTQREIITGDTSGTIRTWDLIANRLNRELKPQGDTPICSMSQSPDGTMLAVCNTSGNCFVWNISRTTPNPVREVFFQTNGMTPASGNQVPSNSEPEASHNTSLDEAGEAPDSERSSLPDDSSRSSVNEPLGFQPLTTWQPHSRYILRTLFSPNGRLLATALDSGFIRLWNVSHENGEPWQQNRVLGRHQKWVWDLAFSDNSEFLFSCSSDKRACLWDLSSGAVIRTYEGHKLALTALALSVSNT